MRSDYFSSLAPNPIIYLIFELFLRHIILRPDFSFPVHFVSLLSLIFLKFVFYQGLFFLHFLFFSLDQTL